mmetsp:Transcript_4156/g.7621  ORF Transcript_4156/g.7621 Transcript_4156/m.7621 type:complete len:432 (-) Transcript_4156:582-1877(-)
MRFIVRRVSSPFLLFLLMFFVATGDAFSPSPFNTHRRPIPCHVGRGCLCLSSRKERRSFLLQVEDKDGNEQQEEDGDESTQLFCNISSNNKAIQNLKNISYRVTTNAATMMSKAFPPIPTQEDKEVSWKDNFLLRPKFVWNEFWLGASYMSRRYPILIVTSLMAHFVRFVIHPESFRGDVPRTTTIRWIRFLRKPQPGLLLDMYLSRLLNTTSFIPLLLKFWGKAAVEEVAYRGVEQNLQCWNARLTFFLQRWTARQFVWFGLAFFLLQIVDISSVFFRTFHDIMSHNENKLLYFIAALPYLLMRGGSNLILLPTLYSLWKLPALDEKQQQGINNITDPIGIPNTEVDFQKERIIQSSRLYGRFRASCLFGIAHLPSETPANLSLLKHSQKCFGTFASSFLIEGRLLTNRQTIWAPIGAHVMFNAITAIVF